MKLRFLSLTMVFLLLSLSGSYAIIVLPISEQELTERATVIFTGEVEDVTCSWDQGHNSIDTYIKFRLTRVLKGEIEDDALTIRQPGGTVGDQTVTVPGCPNFELGDEVMIFAGPLGQSGYYGILGNYYGKYNIELEPSTGMKYVTGVSFTIDHVDPKTFEKLPRKVRPSTVYLNDFLTEVQGYIDGNR